MWCNACYTGGSHARAGSVSERQHRRQADWGGAPGKMRCMKEAGGTSCGRSIQYSWGANTSGGGQVGTQLGSEQVQGYRADFELPSTAGRHAGLGRCRGRAELARRAHRNIHTGCHASLTSKRTQERLPARQSAAAARWAATPGSPRCYPLLPRLLHCPFVLLAAQHVLLCLPAQSCCCYRSRRMASCPAAVPAGAQRAAASGLLA